jgi:hypothetical protein
MNNARIGKFLRKSIYSTTIKNNSNITSFFRFVNKPASYPFGIISLAHAPVNVTDFSIGSIEIEIEIGLLTKSGPQVTRIIQSLCYSPAGRYINAWMHSLKKIRQTGNSKSL